jgi:hypothetical protein
VELNYDFRKTVALLIRVPSALYKFLFAYASIVNELSSEPGSTVPVRTTHGPKVQQKQPASLLEWDAEEQQVPPSSPTTASS